MSISLPDLDSASEHILDLKERVLRHHCSGECLGSVVEGCLAMISQICHSTYIDKPTDSGKSHTWPWLHYSLF